MYWTLETRPPTLDEIVHQGAQRMAAAVEAVIERHSKEWMIETAAITASYTVKCSLREHDDSLDALSYGLSLLNKAERLMDQQQLQGFTTRRDQQTSDNPYAATGAIGGGLFGIGLLGSGNGHADL